MNKVKGWHSKPFGKPTVLTFEEEVEFTKLFTVCADFGYPLIEQEIRLIIQQYLNSLNRKTTFKNNLPGKDCFMNFKSRHSDRITKRVAQNIQRVKAKTLIKTIENYFNELEKSIQGVSPKNIPNFDETNFSDISGSQRCLFRRKVKYPERIMNYSKGATSVIFAGTAEGQILPPTLSIRAQICGVPGVVVVQKEHALTKQKVAGLMLQHLMTGSKQWLYLGPKG